RPLLLPRRPQGRGPHPHPDERRPDPRRPRRRPRRLHRSGKGHRSPRMTEDPALAIYAANAHHLAQRYDRVTTDTLLAGLTDLIPPPPAPVLDTGAGSGRDTAWFIARGHGVTAAEPVAAFREMIAARAPAASLAATSLPDLPGL